MATNRKQDNAANPPQKQSDGTYASRSHRISKEDLYILLALFMEDFPLETKKGEPAKQREEKNTERSEPRLYCRMTKFLLLTVLVTVCMGWLGY